MDTFVKKLDQLFVKSFIFNPCPMTISVINSGRCIAANTAYIDLLGYDDMVGKTSEEINVFVNYSDRIEIVEIIKKYGFIRNFEVKLKSKKNAIVIVLLSSQLVDIEGEVFILTILVDITEKRHLEEEIFRSEQYKLIGQMSAGISHEVRNPMTTVKGFLQMFMKKAEYTHHKEYLELMISELDRANSIITEFLSIAKSNPLHPKYELQNLTKIIIKLKPLIEAEILEKGHQLHSCLLEIPEVVINEKELRQLLLNLVSNALDAMPRDGILTIKTFCQDNQVVLSVQDQGKGIDKSIINKLGTPFFTTKDTGTGLGLAVCYGIAHRHNATINIDTGANGTTFAIHFPIP